MQKNVSLSSSEEKYVALSAAIKEVMFFFQLLGSMKIVVEYLVMVRVDNVGAISGEAILPPHHAPSMWISVTSI